jgi:hypothetical protein
LNNAHNAALGRAHAVVSYQGYAAVLAGFAAGMGDKHIWSRPTFLLNVPRWAGIIVSKRGNSAQPPSLMKGRLLLLMDSLCFSSCLLVTDDFLTAVPASQK